MKYQKAEAEVIRFENEDILTKSCTGLLWEATGWPCLNMGVLEETEE